MLPDQRGKAYTADAITVFYNRARCIHAKACVRGLPQVFNPDDRPWIHADRAAAEAIAAVVQACPSGALHYILSHGPEEAPTTPTVIEPQPNGPTMVRGDLEIHTPDGVLRDTRAALCRCGQSLNKPFCDGTHARVGWQSDDTGAA